MTRAGRPGALPPTSLIISTRNRADMLADTVQSVLQGEEVPSELIVVDQSDQSIREVASGWRHPECDVRYLWTPTTGLSLANNLGVSEARHEVLAFTHDDVRVGTDWFGGLIRTLLEKGPESVVTGRVSMGEPEIPGGFQQTLRDSDMPMEWQGRTREFPLLVLNMAMYRGAYEKVRGFDERLGPGTPFPGAEDVDLGFRLLEAGYRIVYSPHPALRHRAWRAPESYLPIRWAYGVALGGYFGKHFSLRDRWVARSMLSVLRHRTWQGVRRLITEPGLGWGHLVSSAGILTGMAKWWMAHGWTPRP